MFIYCIENKINGKKYIGLTTKSIEERWHCHVVQAKQNAKRNMVIAKAILKYGKENFEISVLEECVDEKELRKKEKVWIAELNTFNDGYNMTLGGDGLLGYKHTDETKEKMSKSQIGNKNNKGHFKGRNHSEHSKKLISEKNSGSLHGMFGKTHTDEVKKAISEKHKKKVAQYDDNENLVNVFISYQEAAKFVNGKPQGISRCCRGIRKHHRGYIWKEVNYGLA